MRAMIFIDFENFDIAKFTYYKQKCLLEAQELARAKGCQIPDKAKTAAPRLDFNMISKEIIKLLGDSHELVKTFLFAPKPDDFLMGDTFHAKKYNWINGLKNQNFFAVIEGVHLARPVSGYTRQTMSLDNPSSYYVVEKGTDINLATHVIAKGFHNAYDIAIIMSGDTDYLPVMSILNTIGKTVVVVGVKGQGLSKFKQYSDAQFILDDDFFQKCLRQ